MIFDHVGLTDTQKSKAKKLVKLGLIKEVRTNVFLCYPVKGYNKTTYAIKYVDGRATCDCFYYRQYQRTCSHMLAVALFKRGAA